MRDVPVPGLLAATVVLLRDGDAGPEVLLLERPGRGTFPGAWVFPGGRVEPEDGEGDAGLVVAGVRETLEETGLTLDGDALVPLSRWDPPLTVAKRYRTTFFVARAPEGQDLRLQESEAVSHTWITPAAALDRHGRGDMVLVPPTWVTLDHLREETSVTGALERAASSSPEQFFTQWVDGPEGPVSLWGGDAAHGTGDLEAPGPRHRLAMGAMPWVYTRTD